MNTRRLAAIQTALDDAQERLYILDTDVERPTQAQIDEYEALDKRLDRLMEIAYRVRYTSAERAARAEAARAEWDARVQEFRRTHGLTEAA